mgnify:CR=1 FL=1
MIQLEKETRKNAPENRLARLSATERHWPEILKLIDGLPPVETIEKMLSELDAPINPVQVGVDSAMVAEGVLSAKELRDRYTLYQLLWDLGLLDDMSGRAVRYFEKGQARAK